MGWDLYSGYSEVTSLDWNHGTVDKGAFSEKIARENGSCLILGGSESFVCFLIPVGKQDTVVSNETQNWTYRKLFQFS